MHDTSAEAVAKSASRCRGPHFSTEVKARGAQRVRQTRHHHRSGDSAGCRGCSGSQPDHRGVRDEAVAGCSSLTGTTEVALERPSRVGKKRTRRRLQATSPRRVVFRRRSVQETPLTSPREVSEQRLKDETAKRMSEMSTSVSPNIRYKHPAPELATAEGQSRAPLTSPSHRSEIRGRRTTRNVHTGQRPFRLRTRRPKPSRSATKSGLASHVASEHSQASRVTQQALLRRVERATYLSQNRHTADPVE